ncbi:peptidase inhibitor family I36 protein [Amycolatopsis magusensis]|uniref:peptidase inhibitor family I36 protein n=1 Tax=Amycolatopsis magusensis TaxID=882444 RepID=UPI003C2F7377
MRKLISAAVVSIAVAGGLGLAAMPASAGVQAGSCSSGNFCLFENNDYNNGNTNHWLDLRSDDWDLNNNYWVGSNDSIDNETSSVKNRRGCQVRLWQHVGGTGAHTRIENNQDDGFLSNNAIGDNRLSAVDICAPDL